MRQVFSFFGLAQVWLSVRQSTIGASKCFIVACGKSVLNVARRSRIAFSSDRYKALASNTTVTGLNGALCEQAHVINSLGWAQRRSC